MTGDRPGTREKIAHAHESSDLTHRDRACDVDKLAAVGMAAARRPIAVELMRLKYSNDAHSYRPAMELLVEECERRAARQNWCANPLEIRLLCRSVLDDWIAPGCRTCNGLGFRKLPEAPTLEARPCPACHGTGRRPFRLPRKLASRPLWERRWRDLSHWLIVTEDAATVTVRQKLRAP